MNCFLVQDTAEARRLLARLGLGALAVFTRVSGGPALAVTARTWEFLASHRGEHPLPKGWTYALDEEDVLSARSRILVGPRGAVSDPLPAMLVDELILRLHLQPEISVEYQLRGKTSVESAEPFRNLHAGEVMALDVAGCSRRYLFRVHRADVRIDGDVHSRYAHLGRWLREDGHRLILSAGGGGFRSAGSIAALKILDLLGLRQHVDEIWGTSAGALLTFPYACGLGTQGVERLIYRYCYTHHPEFDTAGGTMARKLFKMAMRGLRGENVFEEGVSRFDAFIEKFVGAVARDARRATVERSIPFFAVATNLDTFEPLVLTRKSHTRPYLSDFVQAASGKDALQATATIPFLFPAKITKRNRENDYLVDGGLTENLPLMLPYLKWKRDLLHEPGTARKLKIFYIEVRDVPKVRPRGKRASVGAWIHDVVNSSFCCNINLKFRFFAMEQDVEIVGIRLHLPDFSLMTHEEVHDIVLAGSEQVLEEFDRVEERLSALAPGLRPDVAS